MRPYSTTAINIIYFDDVDRNIYYYAGTHVFGGAAIMVMVSAVQILKCWATGKVLTSTFIGLAIIVLCSYLIVATVINALGSLVWAGSAEMRAALMAPSSFNTSLRKF